MSSRMSRTLSRAPPLSFVPCLLLFRCGFIAKRIRVWKNRSSHVRDPWASELPTSATAIEYIPGSVQGDTQPLFDDEQHLPDVVLDKVRTINGTESSSRDRGHAYRRDLNTHPSITAHRPSLLSSIPPSLDGPLRRPLQPTRHSSHRLERSGQSSSSFGNSRSRDAGLTFENDAKAGYHIWAYIKDPYGYRDLHIPGPWLAKLSDFWLARNAASGKRSERVHREHLKYGTYEAPTI